MLHVITMEDRKRWDEIVKSFSDYDVYYLSGYVLGFQLHGDGYPILFYYEGNGIRGINVVMKRDIAQDKSFRGLLHENCFFDFSTPYGYGGWLIEGNGEVFHLISAYEKWCQNHGIVSEFVRFHPVLENYRKVTAYYDTTALGNTVLMDLSTPEVIWSNLSSKNRNVIRKAQKAGVRIRHDVSPEIYETFRAMYNDTMDRNNAGAYYYFEENYYQSLLTGLPQEGQVFYAVLNDQIIAAAIIIGENGHLNYHLSGSKKEYQNYAPTNLLLYEVALWGNANGYKTLHLGGGVGAQRDSLLAFKRAFYRGELSEYYIGKKEFMPETYGKLCAIRGIPPRGPFFPAYRG